MNFIITQLIRAGKNPHTTGAAIVVILGELANGMTSIWWPLHKDQVDATMKLIQKAAVAYGLVMAGDSSASVQKPTTTPTPPPP